MRRQRASGDKPRATGYKFSLAPLTLNLLPIPTVGVKLADVKSVAFNGKTRSPQLDARLLYLYMSRWRRQPKCGLSLNQLCCK